MQLKTIRIKNFRRLKDAKIDIELNSTIFVGANNSGKTSVTHVLSAFLNDKGDFSLYDFSAECWNEFQAITESPDIANDIQKLPKIVLDMWFDVAEDDLNYIIDLLPGLDWSTAPVGIRLEFACKDATTLLKNYQEHRIEAEKKESEKYKPWPKGISDYLSKRLKQEYTIFYYILDYNQYDVDLNEICGYTPTRLKEDSDRNGSKIIKSLIQVDFLNAQRYLADVSSSGRSEDLSRRLHRFYERNLEKKADDITTLAALAESEAQLTNHLSSVFEPTIKSLHRLGYPGFTNEKLVIKAAYQAESIRQSAQLHYSIGDVELPDRYNGLGFKNLIYMVIEILDFHERWAENKDSQAPLHLILIEEPEAHLHAQLQQVFIKQVLKIIEESQTDQSKKSQLLITTQSPHIIYESGFQPIRYFNRISDMGQHPRSIVLNLSNFYNNSKPETREFLEKYMKLTHCDLFFADAAILVEGNVERLLLPLMIQKAAVDLQSSYLSIIEVGGAFAYRFKELIDFLGLTTLIITDLDSVLPSGGATEGEVTEEDEEEQEENIKGAARRGACMVDAENAETSNQTLITWLPGKRKISEILSCSETEYSHLKSDTNKSSVRICYQSRIKVKWENEEQQLVGRTLEEAFALQNLDWCQNPDQVQLGLRVLPKSKTLTLSEINKRIYARVKSSGFNKTDFALGVLMADQLKWEVPAYIADGLKWLLKVLGKHKPISDVKDLIDHVDVENINTESETRKNKQL